ncbi:MAG: hypothetical protein IH596_14050 [Bacteroidales bacterium]|nr:hypothetical protein [Bacteroidales bacterium]
MKPCSIFLLFLSFIASAVYSQDTITVFFDKDWNEITDKTEAIYYRKAFPESNNGYVVNDYYISGKIQMTGLFKSKKLKVQQGFCTYYFEDGQKSSEGMYEKNKKVGEWTYWFEDGKQKSRGKFIANKKDGEWNYWDEEGFLKDKECFTNGVIYSAEGFHVNGQKRYSGEYEYGRRQGEWTYWNASGRICYQGNFKNGLKEGDWIRYFSDSSMTLHYTNGVLDGKPLGGIVRVK